MVKHSDGEAILGSWRYFLAATFLYGCAYAALLTLASYMHGLAGFSLWFPAAGLRFALILLLGWRFGFAAATAEILAQGALGDWALWRHPFLPVVPGIASPPLIYAGVLGLLTKWRLVNASLAEFKHILVLCIAAIVAPAVAAPLSASVQFFDGLLAEEEMTAAIMSFWVGDMIGIFMLAPITILTHAALKKRSLEGLRPIVNGTFATEFVAALLFIWLTLHYAGGPSLSLRWLPFALPVLAISLRHGFAGASLIVLGLNVMIIPVAADMEVGARLDLQVFLALLSLVGLILGALMTAKRQAKEQLADQFKTLAHLDRMNTMGEMAAHIIHELAQPISTTSLYARGAVQMLERGELDRESLLEAITMAARETERTQELIRRMKMFARKGELVREETTAQAIIEGIAHMIDLAAKQCGAEVRYELPDEPLPLNVDVIQLQQAILNLARNGFEAMQGHANNCLTIRAAKSADSKILIHVQDTGPGIPEQLERSGARKTLGMGLGLKIVQAITDAHNGGFDRRSSQITL